MSSTADHDPELQLSAETLAALNSFLTERQEQEKRFLELQAALEEKEAAAKKIVRMSDFEEDWQQSQFWYSDETAEFLAMQLLDGATEDMKIALVSAPSVYVKIRELKALGRINPKLQVWLLEYDTRFAVFKDEFVMYDFQQPFRLPAELKGAFDRVLVDPPFLSEDCQTKTALSVRWLTKPWNAPTPPRVILCTGERMQELVERLYKPVGLRCTTYDIKHTNQLGNEFRCYSSYESEVLKHGQVGDEPALPN